MSDRGSSSGIGFTGLLQIVFIVLKLTHVIDWKWWVVLLPAIIEGVLLLALLAYVVPHEVKKNKMEKEARERYVSQVLNEMKAKLAKEKEEFKEGRR